MNDFATHPGSATALKLLTSSTETSEAAVRPVTPVPVLTPALGTITARTDQAERKDSFVASAALGGIIAALAMVVLVPICFLLVNAAKRAFSDAPAVTATVQEVTPTIAWPDVALSGILAADPKRGGSAILNGQLINLNQQILSVRVAAFHEQEVVLEYQGARKTLRVGENTL